MSDDPHQQLLAIRKAILAGDTARARHMLKALSRQMPDHPDVYYYGAFVAKDATQAQQFVARALALSADHDGAQRLQHQLAKTGALALRQEVPMVPITVRRATTANATAEMLVTPEAIRRRRRGRQHSWLTASRGRLITIGLSALLLSLSASWLVMLLLGFGAQYVNGVLGVIGAPPPITEYDGQPITEYANPAALPGLAPSYISPLARGEGGATGDVMRDGALHVYEFEATAGEELAVAIQFFSPMAGNVRKNVAVYDASDNLATNRCQQDTILDEQTGVVYICSIHISGSWSVRVFGREGESSGAYVVTAAALLP